MGSAAALGLSEEEDEAEDERTGGRRDDWREVEGVLLVDAEGKGPDPSSERISAEVRVEGSEDSI